MGQQIHQNKEKVSGTRGSRALKKSGHDPTCAENDMNSVMIQIQMQSYAAKGHIESPVSPKRGGLTIRNDLSTGSTRALHQIGVKKDESYSKKKNVMITKKDPNINEDIQHSLQLMKYLSSGHPGPYENLQYYQKQINAIQSMNEQLIAEQAQEAYFFERKEEAERLTSKERMRKMRAINQFYNPQQMSKNDRKTPKINDEQKELIKEDRGLYIDQIQSDLKSIDQKQSVDPIIEKSPENSEMPWLGTAGAVGEWGDTGENDQYIKKSNIKNYIKTNKHKVKKQPRPTPRLVIRDDKMKQEGETLPTPHLDLNKILQNEQAKLSRFKGSKIYHNQPNNPTPPTAKQSSSQALLFGAQLTPSPVSTRQNAFSPEPFRSAGKCISIRVPYKSPYRIDKKHIQRHVKYLKEHLPVHAKGDEKNIEEVEENIKSSDMSDESDSRADSASSQQQNHLGPTPILAHRYDANLKQGDIKQQQDSPDFRPYEIEDITTWIARKKKQAYEQAQRHEQSPRPKIKVAGQPNQHANLQSNQLAAKMKNMRSLSPQRPHL